MLQVTTARLVVELVETVAPTAALRRRRFCDEAEFAFSRVRVRLLIALRVQTRCDHLDRDLDMNCPGVYPYEKSFFLILALLFCLRSRQSVQRSTRIFFYDMRIKRRGGMGVVWHFLPPTRTAAEAVAGWLAGQSIRQSGSLATGIDCHEQIRRSRPVMNGGWAPGLRGGGGLTPHRRHCAPSGYFAWAAAVKHGLHGEDPDQSRT